MKFQPAFIALASFVVLTGCGDPLVGTWKGEMETTEGEVLGDTEFTIEADEKGSSTFEDQYTIVQNSLSWSKASKNQYDVTETCESADDPVGDSAVGCPDPIDWNCELSDDAESLECLWKGGDLRLVLSAK